MENISSLIKQKGVKQTAQSCEEWLIEHGYIKNKTIGWEKPEVLEMFGLDIEMENGIPAQLYDEEDTKMITVDDVDQFGKRTGNKTVQVTKYKTGKKVWGASQAFLAYKRFKKDQYRQWFINKYGPEAERNLGELI